MIQGAVLGTGSLFKSAANSNGVKGQLTYLSADEASANEEAICFTTPDSDTNLESKSPCRSNRVETSISEESSVRTVENTFEKSEKVVDSMCDLIVSSHSIRYRTSESKLGQSHNFLFKQFRI